MCFTCSQPPRAGAARLCGGVRGQGAESSGAAPSAVGAQQSQKLACHHHWPMALLLLPSTSLIATSWTTLPHCWCNLPASVLLPLFLAHSPDAVPRPVGTALRLTPPGAYYPHSSHHQLLRDFPKLCPSGGDRGHQMLAYCLWAKPGVMAQQPRCCVHITGDGDGRTDCGCSPPAHHGSGISQPLWGCVSGSPPHQTQPAGRALRGPSQAPPVRTRCAQQMYALARLVAECCPMSCWGLSRPKTSEPGSLLPPRWVSSWENMKERPLIPPALGFD